jgi:hypothetical protein
MVGIAKRCTVACASFGVFPINIWLVNTLLCASASIRPYARHLAYRYDAMKGGTPVMADDHKAIPEVAGACSTLLKDVADVDTR